MSDDDKETRKHENQVVESFTACKHFTISKLKNGGTIAFHNVISYDGMPPVHAAALKTLTHTIACHHLAGVDINADAYVTGVELVLQSLCQGAAEIWGYEHGDD